ncbi:prepilin-type N-terminal cleavage/methylation domain-containing protein [Paraglaciecola aquimarina]|uniref:Prepilin-type N-terminal cleavage/methylation domain-containing protein n=1 Tax=Paraglaciecola aquimarina TaxID=1235557 RepID=A0ABU3T0R1_9ALTE|nr:prepilin-type N-terminal cleavage/methylation domain-containing protein [Paraglaciecola aquimarina]MDU0355859.1 prepilin-type N-terminal cleavage/methylation domain-containing protein [Paraglaciecola aquimarina]
MQIPKQQILLSNHSGFTLLELVITIVLLAILSITVLPKFINLKSDANISVISATVGAIKSSVPMFKFKTITAGTGFTSEIEILGVKGSYYQPWAVTATPTGFLANYSSPPEIFEWAGIDPADWAYRIFISNGTYAVVAAPKNVLDLAEPSESEVKATNCYFIYHWQGSGEPILTTVFTGC